MAAEAEQVLGLTREGVDADQIVAVRPDATDLQPTERTTTAWAAEASGIQNEKTLRRSVT